MSVAELLLEELRNLGLTLSRGIQDKLCAYVMELEHWNRVVNLTALRGRELVRRLLVEPIWIGNQLQISGTVVDIGSGNGSPGIPLAIAWPVTELHLIEARIRRSAFLRHVTQKIDLKGITVHNARLEDVQSLPGPIDWMTLQAIHPTPHLFRAMKAVGSSTTRVVWITSLPVSPVSTADLISVPGSTTKIWVFRLDQS